MEQVNKNISIAIFGTVSAGKSTFSNAIIGKSLATSGIKRTTMIPTLFEGGNNKMDSKQVDHIDQRNLKILKSTESGIPLSIDDCDDMVIKIPHIDAQFGKKH